jgi:hypothetical protein
MTTTRCSEHEMRVLVPIDELGPRVRPALVRWLREHDIAPAVLAVGPAIERDPVLNVLVWREQRSDGSIVKRWRYAPMGSVGSWPSPFPSALQDVDESVRRARTRSQEPQVTR